VQPAGQHAFTGSGVFMLDEERVGMIVLNLNNDRTFNVTDGDWASVHEAAAGARARLPAYIENTVGRDDSDNVYVSARR
jgi:hypothetical protein